MKTKDGYYPLVQTITFPAHVVSTPCKFKTNSRVHPRGSRYGSVHGAIRKLKRSRVA
jgi:hypothetical protein